MKTTLKRIALLLPTIITKNGTAKQSLELAKQLEKRGYIITFITFVYIEQTAFSEFKKFTIRSVTSSKQFKFLIKFMPLVTLEAICLYIQCLVLPIYINILHEQEADVYIANDWFTMWVLGFCKTRRAVAIINDVPERTKGFVSKIKLYFDRKYSKIVKKFIVLDTGNRKKLISWLGDSVENCTEIVRSGIDASLYTSFKDIFDVRQHLNLHEKDYIFVCANLMARHRRYEDVLQAFSNLTNKYINIHLVILTKLDFDKIYAKKILDL